MHVVLLCGDVHHAQLTHCNPEPGSLVVSVLGLQKAAMLKVKQQAASATCVPCACHHHHVTNQAIASMPSTPRPTGAVRM
jgi:hypothetical protein